MEPVPFEVADLQFEKFCRLVHRLSGINLRDGKQALVKARLAKRLKTLGIALKSIWNILGMMILGKKFVL